MLVGLLSLRSSRRNEHIGASTGSRSSKGHTTDDRAVREHRGKSYRRAKVGTGNRWRARAGCPSGFWRRWSAVESCVAQGRRAVFRGAWIGRFYALSAFPHILASPTGAALLGLTTKPPKMRWMLQAYRVAGHCQNSPARRSRPSSVARNYLTSYTISTLRSPKVRTARKRRPST